MSETIFINVFIDNLISEMKEAKHRGMQCKTNIYDEIDIIIKRLEKAKDENNTKSSVTR